MATDPSSDMIAVARQNCAGLSNVSFEQAEGARLRHPDGSFDFVFAIRVVNQTESEDYALRMTREMIRLARSGGLVLVEFANRDRPLAKPSRDVRVSFAQLARVATASGCDVIGRHGVLVFSQSVLDRVPNVLVPLWGKLERGAAGLFWPWASRGYILLRKR
jgi:ubiquinone/menaquinone biosynthesis C-methylase UbiE